MPKKNYHKESGYKAQKKYNSEHLSNFTLTFYKHDKEQLENLAKKNEMSLSQLIKSAIDEKYGTHLSKK